MCWIGYTVLSSYFHVSYLELFADMGSFKSSWRWKIATGYDCSWIRLLFAQIMGLTAWGICSNHALYFHLSFSIITPLVLAAVQYWYYWKLINDQINIMFYLALFASSGFDQPTKIPRDVYCGYKSEGKHRCLCQEG